VNLQKSCGTNQDIRNPCTQNLNSALMKRSGRNVNMNRNPSTHWKNPYVMNYNIIKIIINYQRIWQTVVCRWNFTLFD